MFKQLETEKNKLENVLNNNLTKKRERLQQELREVSLEEQERRLSTFKADKIEVDKRMAELEASIAGMYVFIYFVCVCRVGICRWVSE